MIRFCPQCGGDLVEWQEPRHENGFDLVVTFVGCPKVRDRGAGSPESDRWLDHYHRVEKRERSSNFDPATGRRLRDG